MRGPTRLGIVVHGSQAGTVDLGNEPPLIIGEDNEAEQTPVRRSVSLRWLAGTVLTGVTSIFLMGGALVAALNGPQQFAVAPEAAAATTVAAGEGDITYGQKGDRIQPVQEEVANRQILQVSTVTRQGERDFIKLRPFALIKATLSTHKREFADQIPAYDALRIFADTSKPDDPVPAPAEGAPPAAVGESGDDQFYGANVDGEVAVKVSPFPVDNADLDPAVAFRDPEVDRIVRAAANLPPDMTGRVATPLSFADATAGIDEGEDLDSTFSAVGVRIIPENVSNVAKTDEDFVLDRSYNEKIVDIQKDRDLGSLLQANGVDGRDAGEIVIALSQIIDLNSIHGGQKLRIAFAAADDMESTADRPIRVSIYEDGIHQATVARADSNQFVRADEPSAMPTEVADAVPADGGDTYGGKVYDALYETALEQQVPRPLIDQLIRIFAYDVDFQARTSLGDSIEVFHSLPDEDEHADANEPEVLFAALTIGGVAKRFYRYRTPDDGIVDYYDEEGKSAKKFLMRKPMTTGVLRSNFGYRVHPILGYRRLHAGVDFAAPRGTPILAAGNGIVEKAGRSSGYGNFTLIKHTNGYETAYGHQSAFAKGIVPGAKVRQGQIIGYVGSTGLSTGPHLHFEIRVNAKPVDPLRIRLPRGRVLQADLLASFEQERTRIDALLGNPAVPTKVASTN